MADDQRLASTPSVSVGDPDGAPPVRSLARRHPVGVAVGAGVCGLLLGGFLTASLLPLLLLGSSLPGPFGVPPPPIAVPVPPWGAMPPPPPGWGPPPGGWGAMPPPPPGRAFVPPPPGQLPPPAATAPAPPSGTPQPGGPPPASGQPH